jgi:hypothetical protein
MPFLLAWRDVVCEELSPWKENGESWRRLEVDFPDYIATQSSKQTLYIDKLGLLKRNDYDVEIAAAHYIYAYVDMSGIKFPTVRRVFNRKKDGSIDREPLVISIDLSNIQLRYPSIRSSERRSYG